jgi:ectoine hydroxylase-related dioxygenase (phytanoyl-CoA dioxygenase family)
MNAASTSITEETIAAYRRDGAVPLYGVFSAEWIELLRDGVEQAIADPGPTSKDYAPEGKGRFFTDHFMYRRIDAFRKFTFGSPAGEAAARLMGSSKANLFDEHLLVKEPGTENPTYWHQDLPYFEVAGAQIISLWIPLDRVTKATGTMKVVKGSHLWDKIYQPIRIGLGDLVEEAEKYDGPAPDIDASPDEYNIASWDLQPGDCVAFGAAIVHGAYANTSPDIRRRALAVRFAGDDAVWRPGAYVPSVPDTPDLIPGGSLDSEQYPVVWRA